MTSCPVPEVARLGRTLASWRAELLAYWPTGGASNCPTEALNLLIEKIRRVGRGFRNFRNYRLRLLLHCGTDWQDASTTRIRGRRPRFVAWSQQSCLSRLDTFRLAAALSTDIDVPQDEPVAPPTAQ